MARCPSVPVPYFDGIETSFDGMIFDVLSPAPTNCTIPVILDFAFLIGPLEGYMKAALAVAGLLSRIQNGVYVRPVGSGQMKTGHKNDSTSFHGSSFHGSE